MSEFHHEHEVHEAGPGLGRWVAIFTAVVATLGAVIGHEAGETANRAILLKNEAVLKKTEAADQWSYYQAVSTKSHLMELAMELVPAEKTAGYKDKIDKYAKQKDEIAAKANALEKESADANAESARLSVPRERLMSALALIEIAIAVGSVTVLTRQGWLFAVAILGGVAGVITAAIALIAA